jgi:hypothetical protein
LLHDVIPIGADIGNGSLKLVSNQGDIRLDSYVYYVAERASMAVNSGYVEVNSGYVEYYRCSSA